MDPVLVAVDLIVVTLYQPHQGVARVDADWDPPPPSASCLDKVRALWKLPINHQTVTPSRPRLHAYILLHLKVSAVSNHTHL